MKMSLSWCLRDIPFLLFLLAAASSTALARSWDLHDVSVLLPLSGKMVGTAGLLPRDVYRRHPIGFANDFGVDPAYGGLKAVGLRVDPIARQIRLVWQPVFYDREEKRWSTEDRAGHTFYQLSASEFSTFLQEWTALLDRVGPKPRWTFFGRDRGQPLGLHPAFALAETAAEFSAGIERLLRQYCGPRNLIQYTAMRLMSPDHTWWSFAGIELDRGSAPREDWKPVQIPRIKDGKTVAHYSENKIDFFNLETQLNPKASEVTGMRGQFNFGYDDDTDLSPVFQAYAGATESDRPQFLSALPHVARFQNPLLTTPKTLDCVSCHVAQPVQLWMTRSLRGLRLPPDQATLAFQNPNPKRYDLRNTTVAARSTRILRAFGYFGSEPAINQRLINESAMVADWLSRQLNEKR